MTPGRLQGDLLLGICPPAARAADRPRLRAAAGLVLVAPRDPGRVRLEAGRDPRARRAAGRDRLVDGRLGPGRPPGRQPHPPRHPPAHRAADLRRPDLGRARPVRRGRGRPIAARSGRSACCSSSSCSAPMSPASTPATPSTAGRRWARTGIRPGREWLRPALRNFADNPITVQFVHRWLAFVVAAVAIWLGLAAWARGLRAEGAALIGAVVAQITARHPHPAVGRPDRDRRRPPGDGGAAARGDAHRRPPARGDMSA